MPAHLFLLPKKPGACDPSAARPISGPPPPSWFNTADLYLLPKKPGACHPSEARPISVTNTDNRILASIIKGSLEEALKHWLLAEQNGFVKGRQIDESICTITDLFYKAVEGKKEGYLLLLDYSKAFDSISHEFIFALLEHIGCPPWLISTIRNLLSEVSVRLSLKGAEEVLIRILSGVKQGCPPPP